MPFGLNKSPAVFVSMMYDLRDLWTSSYEKHIGQSNNHGSTIIIDNTLLYANLFDKEITILCLVLEIPKCFNLTWKLKKCKFFDSTVKFVGVNISSKANQPALSKKETIMKWKIPNTS